jgi:hypothetical protein
MPVLLPLMMTMLSHERLSAGPLRQTIEERETAAMKMSALKEMVMEKTAWRRERLTGWKRRLLVGNWERLDDTASSRSDQITHPLVVCRLGWGKLWRICPASENPVYPATRDPVKPHVLCRTDVDIKSWAVLGFQNKLWNKYLWEA